MQKLLLAPREFLIAQGNCIPTRRQRCSSRINNGLVRKALDRENERFARSGGHYSTMIHGHALRKSIGWGAQCLEVGWPSRRGESRLEFPNHNGETHSTRMQKAGAHITIPWGLSSLRILFGPVGQ